MRYPLFLDLTNQPVTVIGAGKVATRKIKTLLQAGAQITVISPAATEFIVGQASRLSSPRRSSGKTPVQPLRWLRRPYRRGDLAGARLVIAATDNRAVNEAVCREAQRRRQLVNCIAPPAAGNFIVPSQIHRGGITLAISTGGASPAFAKLLRRDLERFLAAGYVRRLQQMSAQRKAK
jgi:precorrin-2 dehydrogenase/sirohydrochlorin ferrochelatase